MQGEQGAEGRSEQPTGGVETVAVYKPKSIVLFSDGTGNSSAKLFKTNVWRMYEAVDLGPATEGKRKQIAFYDNGVGTSSLRPLAALAGIFGFGLKRNILEIYRYVCRNYAPAPGREGGGDPGADGDHIYGFGFSRGAFTMRLVIALIAQQGLVRSSTEEELERRSEDAYRAFREDFLPRKWQAPTKWFRARRKRKVEARNARLGIAPYDKSRNYMPVIRFVGAWDTVSAYGGPVSEITRAIDNWIYALSMPDYQLHERVLRARHALAIDDERDAFHPLLWEESEEEPRYQTAAGSQALACLQARVAGLRGDREDRLKSLRAAAAAGARKRKFRDRIEQVWFTGMHADVGGGYPDESLSYVSFLWMMEEAQAAGLRTIDAITDRFRATANSSGPLHDSRSGPGAYYRYQPRRIAAWLRRPDRDAIVQLDPLRCAHGEPVGYLESIRIHQSVAARIASGTDRYAPFTLPARIRIVPPQRQGETAQQADSQTPSAPPAEDQPARPLVSRDVRELLEDPDLAAARIAATEPVWDMVWHRRLIYFGALLATLFLVILPWTIAPTQLERLCSDDRCVITGLIGQLKILIPSFLEGWVDGIATQPLLAIALIALIAVLLSAGRRVERRLREHSHAAWEAVLGRRDWPAPPRFRLPPLWRSPRYRRVFRSLKWTILPSLVTIAFFVLFANLGGAAATQAWLVLAEPRGAFCVSRGEGRTPTRAIPIQFMADARCTDLHVDVKAGEYYEIRLRTSPDWADSGYKADLGDGADLPLYADTAILYRRVIGAPWMKPLIEIRDTRSSGWKPEWKQWALGSHVNIKALHFCPSRRNTWAARFKAARSGRLHIMLNDAALPFMPGAFYGNNRGVAVGTVLHAPINRLRCREP
ncbi:MAG TPA: DUF2235 domain-containing protein [Allosphingosinicella sp.]|nr:DUF2235 domain-containing protein [Allosphingosinicella sp.]